MGLLCVFHMLVDGKLLEVLCERDDFASLVAALVLDLYELLAAYFMTYGDKELKLRFLISSHRWSAKSSGAGGGATAVSGE